MVAHLALEVAQQIGAGAEQSVEDGKDTGIDRSIEDGDVIEQALGEVADRLIGRRWRSRGPCSSWGELGLSSKAGRVWVAGDWRMRARGNTSQLSSRARESMRRMVAAYSCSSEMISVSLTPGGRAAAAAPGWVGGGATPSWARSLTANSLAEAISLRSELESAEVAKLAMEAGTMMQARMMAHAEIVEDGGAGVLVPGPEAGRGDGFKERGELREGIEKVVDDGFGPGVDRVLRA